MILTTLNDTRMSMGTGFCTVKKRICWFMEKELQGFEQIWCMSPKKNINMAISSWHSQENQQTECFFFSKNRKLKIDTENSEIFVCLILCVKYFLHFNWRQLLIDMLDKGCHPENWLNALKFKKGVIKSN